VLTYAARRLGLLSVDLLEQEFETLLKSFILCALVELADKVATTAKRVESEEQCGVAQVLKVY
jgi:hypothetical protein